VKGDKETMLAAFQAIVGFMLRVCQILGRGFMVLACFLFSFLVLLVFIGSVLRYVAGTPLAIADESASLLFLSGALSTLTYGYLDNKLIRISLVWDKLSSQWQRIADAIGNLAGAMVFGVVFWTTLLFAWDTYTHGTRTIMTDIPLWPWAMVVPASLGLLSLSMFLTALAQLIDLLSGVHNPSPAKGEI